MPIEIKELHVRIQVNEEHSSSDKKPGHAAENLLEDCLDEVFSIINEEKER